MGQVSWKTRTTVSQQAVAAQNNLLDRTRPRAPLRMHEGLRTYREYHSLVSDGRNPPRASASCTWTQLRYVRQCSLCAQLS
jgi:hypothetical protein